MGSSHSRELTDEEQHEEAFKLLSIQYETEIQLIEDLFGDGNVDNGIQKVPNSKRIRDLFERPDYYTSVWAVMLQQGHCRNKNRREYKIGGSI
jgi:hypothetical protein